jgi:hypothetical protein
MEFHHIKQWAAYRCHNASDMVAICPSCHYAAHHGALKISDDDLYRWKKLDRSDATGAVDTAQIYVEPSRTIKLLTGTVAISASGSEAAVFSFSGANRLKLRVLDGDLLQISARFYRPAGLEILRVVENNVRVVRDKNVKFEFRAGRACVTLPADPEYIPEWVLQQMRINFPMYGSSGRVVALDVEVVKPGHLRVQGLWVGQDSAVVIDEAAIYFCNRRTGHAFAIVGEGEYSVIEYAGPITEAMFRL